MQDDVDAKWDDTNDFVRIRRYQVGDITYEYICMMRRWWLMQYAPVLYIKKLLLDSKLSGSP